MDRNILSMDNQHSFTLFQAHVFRLVYDDSVINTAQLAFSFFKPFPRKCLTARNGPSNGVVVMSWTAAFLQDKLRHITLVSVD